MPSMPKWGLHAFTPPWRSRLFRHPCRPATLAMRGLRAEILCLDGRHPLRQLCALPALREFRSPARCPGKGGAGHADSGEALAGFPGLSLRSMPSEVFQCSSLPAHRSVHDPSSATQGLRILTAWKEPGRSGPEISRRPYPVGCLINARKQDRVP